MQYIPIKAIKPINNSFGLNFVLSTIGSKKAVKMPAVAKQVNAIEAFAYFMDP